MLEAQNSLELHLRGDLTLLQVHLSFLLKNCLPRCATCYMLRPVEGSSAMRGRLGLMCEPTAVGRHPTSTSRETEIGGSHMSRKNSTALAVGAAVGGAAVAAALSMGTAHAVVGDADGYEDLFGGPGTIGISAGQIRDNVALDAAMAQQNLGNAQAFDTLVDNFENSGTAHPLEQLFFGLDPSSYVTQFDPDINGYLPNAVDAATGLHGYLVPDDFLGYLGTALDVDLLNPT